MINLDASQIIIQIIGFLVMLWVMKRYGWKPLLDLLDARKKSIQEEFDSINAQKEQVKQLTEEYEEKLKQIESAMNQKIQQAVEDGRAISIEIQHDAQAKALEILHSAKAEVEGVVAKAKDQLKNDVVSLVMSITRKILKEELDGPGQKKLIANFIDEA